MKKRVLIGELKHETNSFIPGLTDRVSYENFHLKTGEETAPYFSAVKTEMLGFMQTLEEEGIEFTASIGAEAVPGGPVERSFFDFAMGNILKSASDEGPFDGILLALHGAMVLEDSFDAEGELLSAIRKTVGHDMPVMATLDLHGNFTEEMQRHATACFGYDTYPHIDMLERGAEAARIMARTIRGEIRPVMRSKRIPILSPTIPTAKEPYAGLMRLASGFEKEPGVLSVSVMHGFPWSDIPEAGVSVLAVTDNDEGLAEKIVTELGSRVWERRGQFTKKFITPETAVKMALESSEFPVLLADTSDNPGGGAPADGTQLLSEMIRQNVENAAFALIADPESAERAFSAGRGNPVRLSLGGKSAPRANHGAPIEAEGRVITLSDGRYTITGPMCTGLEVNMGKTAVVQIGGIYVIICTLRTQPWDAEVFRKVGIEPASKKILCVKSAAHFRASFEPIAAKIIEVDLPGLVSNNFSNFTFRNILRPVFPLDPFN